MRLLLAVSGPVSSPPAELGARQISGPSLPRVRPSVGFPETDNHPLLGQVSNRDGDRVLLANHRKHRRTPPVSGSGPASTLRPCTRPLLATTTLSGHLSC